MQLLLRVYCFFLKLGLLNYGWAWKPRQGHSLCDCSFRGSSQVFRPTQPQVLFVNSIVQIKINLAQNTHVCSKGFQFSFCPGYELKSPFLVFCRKLMHHCNYVCGHFKIHPNYILHCASSHCTRTSYLPCWFATAALVRHTRYLPRLQVTAHLECADPSLLSHSLLLQTMWISEV